MILFSACKKHYVISAFSTKGYEIETHSSFVYLKTQKQVKVIQLKEVSFDTFFIHSFKL